MSIHFLLTPDKLASRRVRRRVAEAGAVTGVIVGTWTELVAKARAVFLLGEPAGDWNHGLAEAAKEMTGAFWRQSLERAPAETLAVLDRALRQLLAGLGPDRFLQPAE